VHISEMANQYVSDPYQVVKVGQIVKVKVMSVDIPRKRIGLSMKMGEVNNRPAKNENLPKPKLKITQKPKMEIHDSIFGSALQLALTGKKS